MQTSVNTGVFAVVFVCNLLKNTSVLMVCAYSNTEIASRNLLDDRRALSPQLTSRGTVFSSWWRTLRRLIPPVFGRQLGATCVQVITGTVLMYVTARRICMVVSMLRAIRNQTWVHVDMFLLKSHKRRSPHTRVVHPLLPTLMMQPPILLFYLLPFCRSPSVTGVRKYHPEENFGKKDAGRWVLKHLIHKHQHIYLTVESV